MDYTVPVIVIMVVVILLWLIVACASIAMYAILRNDKSKDNNVYRAKNASLIAFLVSFFSFFLTVLLLIVVIIRKLTGSNEDVVNRDTKETSSISANYKFIYSISLVMNVVLILSSLVVMICSFYALQLIRTSQVYKANTNDSMSHRFIAASLVSGPMSGLVLLSSVVSVILSGVWWSSTQKLVPSEESGSSSTSDSPTVGETEPQVF